MIWAHLSMQTIRKVHRPYFRCFSTISTVVKTTKCMSLWIPSATIWLAKIGWSTPSHSEIGSQNRSTKIVPELCASSGNCNWKRPVRKIINLLTSWWILSSTLSIVHPPVKREKNLTKCWSTSRKRWTMCALGRTYPARRLITLRTVC